MTSLVGLDIMMKKQLWTFCVSVRHILPIGLNILLSIYLSFGNCMTSLFIVCWTLLWLLVSFRFEFGDSTIDLWSWCWVLSKPPIFNSFIHSFKHKFFWRLIIFKCLLFFCIHMLLFLQILSKTHNFGN